MKKWLPRIAFALALLAACGWLAGSWVLRRSIAQPPAPPVEFAALSQLRAEKKGGRICLGRAWLERREGLLVVRLRGTPFEIGYTHGALMSKEIQTLEDEFLVMVRGYVPNYWVMQTLKNYVIYRNRNLSQFVPDDYRMEIFGTSLGCPDTNPQEGAYYNRRLNYHAAHDVSYMMIDNSLVARAGCTSFGAWGQATANGHLLTGRNFDWEAAEVFSRDRTVILCEPDGGIPFISLSWAGMSGVVSGMNRAGVSVTINGAPSRLPGETATPAAILARDVLQKARNLDEALKMIRGSRVFVSTLWMVGSRADGKFVVVEKTPEETAVREGTGDSIVCANHFETAHLKAGARNHAYEGEATSVSRWGRMNELVEKGRGKLDAPAAAAILRDRKLPGGAFAGNGHRGTLNALIATHATIMDLTDGIFWAAAAPHQLGKFVGFDVHDFDREGLPVDVPADAILQDGVFEKAKLARKALLEGERALKHGDGAGALAAAEKAEAANPGFYQNAALRGRALNQLGRRDEAIEALGAALERRPAFAAEKKQIEQWLQQARGGR